MVVLMLASGAAMTDAASKAEISRSTAYRWANTYGALQRCRTSPPTLQVLAITFRWGWAREPVGHL